MNKFFTLKLKLAGLVLLAFAALQTNAQTYTVNASLPTGGTNYQSFTDLINDLNTYGVSGPVVVNVVPGSGPYNDTLHFRYISGASPTNTIRINGNGETVTFDYYNSTYYYYGNRGLILDSTQYLTIDSLVFKANDTSTYYGGGGAIITGGAAYDSIIHCVFDQTRDSATAYYYGGYGGGIVFTGNNYYYYYYNHGGGSHCYIGYNHIIDSTDNYLYGYGWYNDFGIAVMDSSDNNTIAHNTIECHPLYGIYIYGAKNTKVLYNDVNNEMNQNSAGYYYGYAGSYGIYTYDSVPGTQIIGNRVHDPNSDSLYYYYYYLNSFYGIMLNGAGSASEPVLVANNAIYNIDYDGTIYGIYLLGSNNKIYHNTIAIDKTLDSTQPNYGIYLAPSPGNSGIEIKNNNVSITGGGTGSKFGFYYSNPVDDAQKNNFYVNSTQPGSEYYGHYGYVNYATMASFQSSYPALELGSPSTDPQFVNPSIGNLSVQNLAVVAQGENLTSVVPLDILENQRPPLPTLGAFEAVLAMNNAAAHFFITPHDSFCPSIQPVNMSIYNAGVNAIDSLQVQWSVNGVLQPPVHYTNTLTSIASTSGQHVDTVLLGNIFIPANNPTTIKAWTALPNGVMDTVNSNDTIIKTFQANPTDYAVTADLDTLCPNLDAHLLLSPDSGFAATQLTWQYSMNGTNWVDIANSDSINYTDTSMTASKWYRVKISANETCYSDTTSVRVIDPQVLTATPAGGCNPSSLTLEATSPPGTILNWYNSLAATTPLNTGTAFTTPSLTATHTYYVAATINGLNGCESPREPVVATIENPLPDIPLHDTTFCSGFAVTLEAGNTGISYLWNTGDTTAAIDVSTAGIYSVIITSFYHCTNTDSFQISLLPLADVNGFDFIPSFSPDLGTVKFFPIDPTNVDHYAWDFGDGVQDTSAMPIHSYAQTGDYLVSLSVGNQCGDYTVSQMIHVDLTTGIVSLNSNLSSEVVLYPNPGRENITIRCENPELSMDRISIYNILGKRVYDASTNGVTQKELSVKNFASGVYSLRITTNKNMLIVRKFEVVH